MRLRKNASFVLRGYPIDDEIGGAQPGAIKEGSYDPLRPTIGRDKRIPFSVVWTDADRLSSSTPTRNVGSVCHSAVGELKLIGIQLAAGCICFLGAIRLAL
jgi:hypothetical protein